MRYAKHDNFRACPLRVFCTAIDDEVIFSLPNDRYHVEITNGLTYRMIS